MKVLPFRDVPAVVWDSLCDSSRQAWMFHRNAWIGIEERHFSETNLSFALESGGELIGLQPLYCTKLGLGEWTESVIHGGLHRHTGLALAEGLSAGDIKAAQSAAMHQIKMTAADLDADRVQLGNQILAPANYAVSEVPFWIMEHGFFLGVSVGPHGLAPAPGMAACCADVIIELNRPEEELFSRLEESCRRAVRKAIAAGLSLVIAGDHPMETYYTLAQASSIRTGETLPPRAYYDDLWADFGTTGLCLVLFAVAGTAPAAALLLLVYKDSVHFLGGVSDPHYLSLRPNDFLHWSAIRWASSQGLARYRLGPVFPELPEAWPIVRVSSFKRKFGGRSFLSMQGSLFRHPAKYSALGATQLTSCVRIADSSR
jgi:hypothetical protein